MFDFPFGAGESALGELVAIFFISSSTSLDELTSWETLGALPVAAILG